MIPVYTMDVNMVEERVTLTRRHGKEVKRIVRPESWLEDLDLDVTGVKAGGVPVLKYIFDIAESEDEEG